MDTYKTRNSIFEFEQNKKREEEKQTTTTTKHENLAFSQCLFGNCMNETQNLKKKNKTQNDIAFLFCLIQFGEFIMRKNNIYYIRSNIQFHFMTVCKIIVNDNNLSITIFGGHWKWPIAIVFSSSSFYSFCSIATYKFSDLSITQSDQGKQIRNRKKRHCFVKINKIMKRLEIETSWAVLIIGKIYNAFHVNCVLKFAHDRMSWMHHIWICVMIFNLCDHCY